MSPLRGEHFYTFPGVGSILGSVGMVNLAIDRGGAVLVLLGMINLAIDLALALAILCLTRRCTGFDRPRPVLEP